MFIAAFAWGFCRLASLASSDTFLNGRACQSRITGGNGLDRVRAAGRKFMLTVQDRTQMTASKPEQTGKAERMNPEVPAPENVPPVNNPDPQPGDPKPKAPPSEDEPGRRDIPVELPGKPGMPERA
jgi:hypothetical protein